MSDLVERLLGEIKKHNRRIVIIGDVIVDRWVHGRMMRCQDGCPKFIQEEVVETPGGAANAEQCLTMWVVKTSLCGYNRNDCPIKTRYVEDDSIIFRSDDDGRPNRGQDYQWSRDLALEMSHTAGGVLLSDYDKGFLTPSFIKEVATVCRERSIPCVADCKRTPETYNGCIRKGNLDWLRTYGREKLDVLTRGANLPCISNKVFVGKKGKVHCTNHVGAGDCFAAHLTLALAYGFSLEEAATIAHSAGRVYVQHPHNRAPSPREISADLLGIPVTAT